MIVFQMLAALMFVCIAGKGMGDVLIGVAIVALLAVISNIVSEQKKARGH